MKKIVLTLSLVFLVSISISINTFAGSNGKTLKLSINDVKKKYTDAKIKSLHKIGSKYLLVESQRPTFANEFDLYNLETGAMDILPTMNQYVTLDTIVNENYFIFLSSGRNDIGPFGNFPWEIKCIRVKDDKNGSDNFVEISEDKYFKIDKPNEAGQISRDQEELADMNINMNSIQISFKAIKNHEVMFYADDTDIPRTKISYDKKENQLLLEIGAEKLGSKFITNKKIDIKNNQFMSAYTVLQRNKKIYIAITLKDASKEYMAKIKRLPDGTPYFEVNFSNGTEN